MSWRAFVAGRRNGFTKKTFSFEITRISVLVSVFSMLILGIALVMLSFFSFSRNARKEINYVAENTLLQFQDKIDFVKNGVIQIRHNTVLANFFSGSFSRADSEIHLSLALDLFSDRNLVQQIPFVQSVYLFNMHGDYISRNYYPQTVNLLSEQANYYLRKQNDFKRQVGTQNYSVEKKDKGIDIYLFVYDDVMRPDGVCVVSLSEDAVFLLMRDVQAYKDSFWEMNFKYTPFTEDEGVSLLRYGNCSGGNNISLSASYGFGIDVVVSVGISNVYSILGPSIWIFALVSIVIVFVVVSVVFWISGRFSEPLKNIVTDLLDFTYGNMDISMNDYDIEEFHNISVVFNEMTSRIKYLVTEVYEKQLLANESQIKFLQSQMNPHFVFNTLAMLSTKAKMAGNDELYKSLVAFAKLMQGKIFRSGEATITLEEEMEVVNFYLFLQNKRFRDKIRYEINWADDGLRHCMVPRLLVESLVENAVVHGLEPKESDGMISVSICERDNMLNIVVADDGVGFDFSAVRDDSVRDDSAASGQDIGHTHTGIENTKRLLQILYGENFKFNISGKIGEGTRADISIPIQKKNMEVS